MSVRYRSDGNNMEGGNRPGVADCAVGGDGRRKWSGPKRRDTVGGTLLQRVRNVGPSAAGSTGKSTAGADLEDPCQHRICRNCASVSAGAYVQGVRSVGAEGVALRLPQAYRHPSSGLVLGVSWRLSLHSMATCPKMGFERDDNGGSRGRCTWLTGLFASEGSERTCFLGGGG
ncbi:hypothetical protein BDZ89DRAFT_147935 [Hymenopellis radicata]|nr:hypothetical protein BDZ89DRAFT_147935 [Hymenopellis radicata]